MTMSIKSSIYLVLLLLVGFTACKPQKEDPDPLKVLAFPDAEGGGRYTTGGRGGVVVHVTNLSDERDKNTGQPAIGTLRKALTMEGTRTVVFDVSGTINLTTQL